MILVAGAGTVGLSTALFLAHHGADVLVVERREGPDVHPRATGVGPRTAELFRELGLEDAVDAAAIPMTTGLGKIAAPTLATADLDALAAAAPPRPVRMTGRSGDFSPAALRGPCPQDRLDRVLLAAARERGVTVAYSTVLTSFTQDETGVTAVLNDGERTVRADHLVAADGARSGVRDALGIGVSGPGALGGALTNILFTADLTPHTRGRSFVTCGTDTGMLVTIDGTRRWVLHVPHEDGLTDARCRDLVRAAVGDPGLDVDIVGAARWRVRGQLADRFREGRVLLAGDAAHTVPPVGAFGMNTGVADGHNLAWKLAAVLDGAAGPGLLDTYEAERRPVAALVLEQALLRLADPRLHWGTGPEAAAARAAAGALHAPIVHLGHRYDSSAIIDARTELPSTEDLVLDGSPGSRVPHLWVADGVSTLDLVASRFTVFTGSPSWLESAEAAGLPAHRVDADWIPEDGLLLVRPDGFVALRTSDPSTDLDKTMRHLLSS
ncbi:FAD-dependent oxidoreductase [Actinomadura harenae]|uniref:2,4-dichlorophenol 6-monooxygenase n=1 Tax=Actinomadura harenae TaxID=2483351 RepID=A0A3M2LP60_9ACTN|nr:FAD-dependent oxidoreductase [Actinomadura harenae]RMI38886.1 2,4-dichlorophenol 6-monooxygenase [Actinomadura harenae]